MIRSKDEIIKIISSRIGEEPTEDDISLLEDVTDTISDFENKTADTTNWKEKYEENDKAWKKKYTERFLNNDIKDELFDDDKDDVPEKLTYDDLFTFS